MNVNITSSECSWSQFSVTLLSRTIKGLRGFSVKKERETEELYGSGDEPLDLMRGNKKYSGNIKILGFEADALNATAQAAGYDDITEVPHEAIVLNISYKKNVTDTLKSYTVRGVAFADHGVDLEQNAKHREITLTFKALDVQHQAK